MPSQTDFDPVATARHLLRTSTTGALATLQIGTSNPFCSLVNTATLPDGSPILLISRLAVHTRNILHDPRVSLLFGAAGAPDPLAAPRVSLSGAATAIEDELQETAFRRYLAAHPTAEVFASFADFSFYRVAITFGHLVAGFGRIIDLPGERILTEVSDAGPLLRAEEGAVAHLNQDHSATMSLYATALLGASAADWRCIGLDPEGLDMRAADGRRVRLNFPQRVVSPDALRRVLKELADHARAVGRKPN
jgi:hypothetical protein